MSSLLLSFDELAAQPPPEWLVDGLVPAGLSVIYGRPSSLKSFVAQSIAASVATGQSWMGREVKPGPVVYLTGEGARGLGKRLQAWRSDHGRPDMSRLYGSSTAVNFLRQRDVAQLREAIAALELEEPLQLLVVDTFAESMAGGDESSAGEVSKVLAEIGGLCENRIVVHHTGHDGRRGRGSSARLGASDLEVFVQRQGDVVELTCAKAPRDGPAWPKLTLKAIEAHGSIVLSLPGNAAAADLAARVFAFVEKHEPTTKNAIRAGVTGKGIRIDEALAGLAQEGRVELDESRRYRIGPDARDTQGHTGHVERGADPAAAPAPSAPLKGGEGRDTRAPVPPPEQGGPVPQLSLLEDGVE
jgi:hypothetical protein